MFWSGFGWVWLGLVKFCKVFDIFLGLLEHVLVWVWLGLGLVKYDLVSLG